MPKIVAPLSKVEAKPAVEVSSPVVENLEDEMDEATPDQMDRLRKVMEAESQTAVLESMDIPDEEDENREKEENERAAAEAAKDLIPDYDIPETKEEGEEV